MLLIIVIVGCCLLHRKRIIHIPFLDGIIPQETVDNGSGGDTDIESAGGAFSAEDITTISQSELSVHFLQLGNDAPGDCTLIKTGNTEVLIDAGSDVDSATTLVSYISDFCTDGVLEYVVATHGDADHISAFVGENETDGIFKNFECGIIIDATYTTKSTDIYQSYVQLRDEEVADGAKRYTALECYNNENGAQRVYPLGNDVTMEILYHKYYEQTTNNENDYSVCTLIKHGKNQYLFTGDLEDGEASLVENNLNIGKCVVYKAGHHGSSTSSSTQLLELIDPDIVVANCVAGGRYNFPKQDFIERISQYTENVYVTTMKTPEEYLPMNGNIVIYTENGDIKVRCSNNDTLFKNTDWFKENRICPDKWKTA